MKLIHFAIAVIMLFGLFTGPVSSQAAVTGSEWEDTIYERPEQFSSFTTEKDVFITMRDGVILAADVHLPDGPGPFPVILTQTPYNKNVSSTENLNEYFIKRGYAHVVVDVRGTGASQGAWDSFGEAEQRDGKELVEWAASQPWSNGKVGLYGSSYRAINQLLTAAQHPDGLEAIFPIVPMGDMYRDILMSGGLINTGFIPLWLGLVTGSGLLPPSYTLSDPIMGTTLLLSHTGQTLGFPVSTLSSAITGGEFAYDGPAAQLRSPLAVADQINVPAFFTGGLHDLFQRGTPLLYEKLKANGVQTKLLMGNWTHGNYGSGLPADNVPALDQLALRWFDQYLMGINTQINKIPDVTQFVLDEGGFEVQPGWPHKNVAAQKFYLRSGNLLTKEKPSYAEPSRTMLQQPLNGICSGSTNQWMAGIPDALPCTKDNRLTEITELTYTTPPANADLRVSGPIAAKIFASTTARDLVLSVRLTDVAPDGTSNEITAGWLAASHRAVDDSKSRYLDGENIQPWHPFTRTAVQEVKPYEVMELDVEIFPSNFVIKEGHKLRVAVGPSDFPHSMSPLPQLLDQLGGVATILNNSKYPSSIVLPVVEE
ncbi:MULTISPECIES: CocE/NonD family hydrolase [unclassified Mesobacillus]|uniref:CocE/NonD family hydrolase n=1 Tax=unclassified Mesobacillus TaxID=2675270 RepID=UPI00203CE5A6|nr:MULTISPECIES: CocE/NonD family hydrolase [unclassified Mesobacillus]MCM3125702.1 CocE/NonD family hydrolase [Mesobacillus sp. MER 33]MCM3235723.1 CocE/NonD family hydrolase [Mesobacillus sp. MER 48]